MRFGIACGAASLCLDGRLRQVTRAQGAATKLEARGSVASWQRSQQRPGETADLGGNTVVQMRKCSYDEVHSFSVVIHVKDEYVLSLA
jgi:hypothetical protein